MDVSLSNSKALLARCELGAAVSMTVAACYLHATFLLRAGGLWRDEVVSFNVATQPTLAAVHEAVRFDSFPSFFHLLLRGWLSLGWGGSDLGARALGLSIGLAVLGALWWNARAFGSRAPLFSLLLLGVSGLCVRTTDAVRAYGVGVLCVALCFGLIWRVATRPSTANVLLAGVAAILAVQSLYQSAFLLAAICLAGALITARHRLWRRTALILGIGLCAALSLTLYIEAMQRMGEIKPLIAASAGLDRILAVVLFALRDGSNLRLGLWLVLLFGYLGLAFHVLRQPVRKADVGEEVVLFTFASVVIAFGGFFVWLRLLGFPTQPWYYVPPMTLLCLALDATWPALLSGQRAGLVRLGGVTVGAVLGFVSAFAAVSVRQTNVDVLAARLAKFAAPGDFILVDQWHNGASFSRYFSGSTPWTTLPPLEDQSLQRLDLFKKFMVASKPTEPVERQIIDTLKSGHRVWLAGGLPMPGKGKAAPELPPAPNSRVGWNHDAYSYVWALQAGELLQTHAARSARVDLQLDRQVSPYENLPLYVVEGWKDEHPTGATPVRE